PIEAEMVMAYPREGATEHTHPAAAVRADWVSADQREGAQRWIEFLHEEHQQLAFMDEGFRPTGGGVGLRCPICNIDGLDPVGPRVIVDPNSGSPAVAHRTG